MSVVGVCGSDFPKISIVGMLRALTSSGHEEMESKQNIPCWRAERTDVKEVVIAL